MLWHENCDFGYHFSKFIIKRNTNQYESHVSSYYNNHFDHSTDSFLFVFLKKGKG